MAGINWNQVTLGGNLTRDPEERFTDGGTPICSFGLAQNERWTEKSTGEKREKANFFDCVAFGGLADTINEHFHKGKPILISGKLDYSTWEAQDGSTRSKVQVKVLGFEFVPDTNSRSSNGSNGQSSQQGQKVSVSDEDFAEIPF
jgi:single-strand DNA-binding protein